MIRKIIQRKKQAAHELKIHFDKNSLVDSSFINILQF